MLLYSTGCYEIGFLVLGKMRLENPIDPVEVVVLVSYHGGDLHSGLFLRNVPDKVSVDWPELSDRLRAKIWGWMDRWLVGQGSA